MPINERTVWIWLPRPNVQGVKRRESEAIGTFEVVIKLAHELRSALSRMSFVPLIGQDQKIGANQLKVTIGLRFVNHDLRLGGINDSAAYQRQVHVVKPHRACVGTRHATEQQRVSFGLGHRDFLEPCCRLAHGLEQSSLSRSKLLNLRTCRVVMCRLCRCASKGQNAQSQS